MKYNKYRIQHYILPWSILLSLTIRLLREEFYKNIIRQCFSIIFFCNRFHFHEFALCFGKKLNPSGTFPSNISLKINEIINKFVIMYDWQLLLSMKANNLEKWPYDNFTQSAQLELAINVSISSRPL